MELLQLLLLILHQPNKLLILFEPKPLDRLINIVLRNILIDIQPVPHLGHFDLHTHLQLIFIRRVVEINFLCAKTVEGFLETGDVGVVQAMNGIEGLLLCQLSWRSGSCVSRGDFCAHELLKDLPLLKVQAICMHALPNLGNINRKYFVEASIAFFSHAHTLRELLPHHLFIRLPVFLLK